MKKLVKFLVAAFIGLIGLYLTLNSVFLIYRVYWQGHVNYFAEVVNKPMPSYKPVSVLVSNVEQIKEEPIASLLPSVVSDQENNISDDDLWSALSVYRLSHGRSVLVKEEAMCAYGRKRAVEHQERFKSLPDGESPLDNHAGFSRDADSGILFSETGFAHVAEVLAFLPNAKTGTEVIEWGWDSSPSHREGLLSNESTHACMVSDPPFFVGILGWR